MNDSASLLISKFDLVYLYWFECSILSEIGNTVLLLDIDSDLDMSLLTSEE